MARQVLDHGVIIPAEYSDDWYEDMSTNLEKLDEVIGSDAGKLSEADVSNVALSGDYDDLTNKPELKPVATSGDYDDLTNKPGYGILRMTSETLSDSGSGAISNLNSDSKLAAGDYVLDAALKVFPIAAVSAPNYTVGTSLFQITNGSALAAVATSGSYDDLNNLPAYGITRFVNAAITDNSNVAFANISSVDKIKAGDFLLDNAGKMYLIASVDTVNETAAVTTPLTVLALDANVMHLSGHETAAGIKTFSDDTFIKSLNFTNEVPSQSSTSSSIMPMIVTITYGDGSPSVQARLNFRITADGSKSWYPHENNQYSLGLQSRRWSSFFGYFVSLGGTYLGNESSDNQRTNLCLLANRDTDGQSGAYITRFRQNRAQGALQTGDSQMIGFDVLENEVRTNNVLSIQCTDWLNNVPQRVNILSGAQSYSYGTSVRKALFNDLNPGALSFPNLDNGLDISGYLTTGTTSNTYTALADGYISILTTAPSDSAIYWSDSSGIIGGNAYSAMSLHGNNSVTNIAFPVNKGVTYTIVFKSVRNIISAKFFPCLGNV